MSGFDHFLEVCAHRARVDADRMAYRYVETFSDDGEPQGETLTFGALDREARALAATLSAHGRPGDRALIVCPQGMDYVRAFFGCLYAGLVAVPAYAPRNNHHFHRLRTIVDDCQPGMVLLCGRQADAVRAAFAADDRLRDLPLVAVDAPRDDDADTASWSAPAGTRDDVAFLQYTSGSTGNAKGIMVTHGNLLANEEMIRVAFANRADSRGVSWLPLFHDMGLMTLLQGVYTGYSTWLMTPMDFLSDPLRWLRTLSRVRATVTVAPNFAWQLCAEKLSPEQIATLDLSCLESAVNGSEPIAPATLDAFVAAFATAGFRREAFRPSYGLAEATLLVTASDGLRPEDTVACPIAGADGRERTQSRVRCGKPAPECTVRIVDPQTHRVVADGDTGEVWVKGPHIAAGYWRNPALSADTFGNRTADGDGPYLRTGDLGLLHGGALIVAGRLKDVIILRGENHYPSDLETAAVGSHERLVADGAAAFTLHSDLETEGADAARTLCLVAEVRRGTREETYPAIAQAIAATLSEAYGLQLARIALIRERSLPKTSSGKVQRAATRDALLDGTLKTLWERDGGIDAACVAAPAATGELQPLLAAADPAGRDDIVRGFLMSLIAEALKVPFYAIDPRRPVAALGLDSLALMEIKARVWTALRVDLSAETLFGDLTVADLVAQTLAATSDAAAAPVAAPVAEATAFEPTEGQRALWMLQQTDPDSNAYNEGFVARVSGDFSTDAFLSALRAVGARHDALQVVFREDDGRACAVPGESLAARVERHETDADALEAARTALRRPFDLAASTWRCTIAIGPDTTWIGLAFHHIVVDMRAFSVLVEELRTAYVACLRGDAPRGIAPATRYAEHAAAHHAHLRTAPTGQRLDAWCARLRDMPARSSLPIVAGLRTGTTAAEHRFALDADTLARAKADAARRGVTLYQLLFAACSLLLSRYAGQRDIVLGMPTLGRVQAAHARTVGYFANVMPVRLQHPDAIAIDDWIVRARDATMDALRHQDLPLSAIDARLAPDREHETGRGASLVQVVLSLLAPEAGDGVDADRLAPFVLGHDGGRLDFGDARFVSVDPSRPRAPFELTLALLESGGTLQGCASYRSDLFPADLIERFCANFVWLVRTLAAGEHHTLGTVPSMRPEEGARVACSLTGAAGDADAVMPVVERFRRMAAAVPQAIALRDARLAIDYATLDRVTDALAARLAAAGIGPDDVVALATRSRVQQAAMALAVAKTGAAYLPLDPAHPAERLAFMLQDSGAKRVLADAEEVGRLPYTGVGIDTVDALADDRAQAAAPAVAHDASRVAYVIYTSGSTGQPKGVVVPHGALANLVQWHLDTFAVDRDAVCSLLAGPGFDASVWELWPGLCAGAALVEPPSGCRHDMALLATWLREVGVTHGFMPTPMAEAFLAATGDGAPPPALRCLLTGGDQLKMRPRAGAGFRLCNAYGPTENAVVATCGEVLADTSAGLPDIGGPIRGQWLRLLDDALRPVPLGVPGELYIGGAGLAHGYRNRPALTAARFVPDPQADAPGARLYATGDMVRLDTDGRLHFMGRNDDQVQIRGYRVEPGEIEAAIAAQPGVRACKVLAVGETSAARALVAYVAADADLREADLRARLSTALPAYMVPADIVLLDALQLDANGKISRRQLRAMAPSVREPTAEPVYADALERTIAGIYGDVLGRRDVRADDDFFRLGGHSMIVHQVVAAIRERLDARVAIADVFAHPSVAGLAARLRDRQAAAAPLPRLPRPERLPLSEAQRRLWVLQQLDPDSLDYVICGALRIRGALDLARLERAISAAVAKHEALRTVFANDRGEPWQRILPSMPAALDRAVVDGGEDALLQALDAWSAQRFDLERGPLFLAKYFDTGEGGCLALCVHHIVADGRTMELLLADIVAIHAGDAPVAATDALQYADYCLWRRSDAALARERESLAFWRDTLDGELPVALGAVAGGGAASSSPSPFGGSETARVLTAATAQRLRALAQRHGVSESTVYLAVYGLAVSRFTGQDEVLLGMACDGREWPELRDTAGMFANVLPIRARFAGDVSFRSLLRDLRDVCVDALRHADADYARIVEQIGAGRRAGAGELVRDMFDFEQIGALPAALGEAAIEVLRRPDRSAKFETTLRCSPMADGGMRLSLNHRIETMSPTFAERFLDACTTLLAQVVEDADAPSSSLRLVDDAQRERLLALGCGAMTAPDDRPVVRSIERIAREHPLALALVDAGGERLRYAEANAQANRIARRLRALGVEAGSAVALCLPPGNAFVLCALATMKLGAAYVPVDPRYPAQRKTRILADCGAALALAASEDALDALPSGCVRVAWDDLQTTAAALPPEAAVDAATPVGMDDLAYIVYTSGTTGQPKGIEIPHRGLVNLCRWHARAYGLEDRATPARASQTAGIGFDAAVWELWPSLTTGGSVWFAPDEARQSSQQLVAWLDDNAITHAFLATPLAHAVLADGWTGSRSLEWLLTGGERLTARASADARYRLVNHYGPSENSVVATAGEVASSSSDDALPSIGRAIDNVRLYVLDRQGQLLPEGVPGELHIGGASLMRGYRGDPAQTRARRVADPHAGDVRACMYRSGDIVRWNAAGELEYVGRGDEQVKIRGHRIEPGEILQAIKARPDVRDAVVTTLKHERQGLQLVAHVVFADGAIDRARCDALRTALAGELPEFMVPAFVVAMDALPLTRNGKVDRAQLPAPQRHDDAPATPPRTPTERLLADIWSELLGEPVVDAHDNFFALGGHSLLASRAVAMIGTRLQREVALKDLFAARDLADLAARLDAAVAYDRIPVAPADAIAPLSPYQKRLWLTQAFNRGNVDHNVVGAVRVTGPIDQDAFRTALDALVARHGLLRTRIVDIGGEPRLEAVAPVDAAAGVWPLNLMPLNLSGNPPEVQAYFVRDYLERLAKEPFDLAASAPFRIVVVQTAADSAVLAVAFHHIVVDAWSANVFMRELLELLAAIADGRAPQLPQLPVQFRDYSLWAQDELARTRDALHDFWRRHLADAPSPDALPVARSVAPAHKRTAARARVAWSRDTLDRLRALARERHASLYEVLLAAHAVWLHRLSGQSDIVIGMPYNDRGRAELADVIGFFVNTLPMRARIAPNERFADFVQRMRTELVEIYGHALLPFDELVERCTRGSGNLFQTMFDLQPEIVPGATTLTDGRTLRADVLEDAPEAAVAELSATFREGADGLILSCVYVAESFEAATVERWLENYRILIEGIAADGDRPLRALAFLTPQEDAAVARLRNAALSGGRASFFPAWDDADDGSLLLHVLVDRQAALAPDRVALRTDDGERTYAQLVADSNRLAHVLLDAGVRQGAVVGLDATHGVEAVIGFLAILKAGAICFPIDPRQPAERIAFLLQDSGCTHLLNGPGFAPGAFAGRCIALDARSWSQAPDRAPQRAITPDYGVYLTYTSGTTGTPKGTILHHRGIVNYIGNVIDRFGYASTDRGLLFAPMTFDASLEEIFVPLSVGASLYIDSEDAKRSVPALLDVCRRHGVSILTLPTAYWRLLVEHLDTPDAGARALGPVRLVSIGGEKLTVEATHQWHRVTGGGVELRNVYGPSECTVGSIVDRVDSERGGVASEIHLHDPIVNAELHLLDAHMNPVPAGSPGELYIGGAGVGHGYHRRPALTSQRFVPNPFSATGGERLYRTGDLASYDLDGRLQFIGRVDFQIKVDGIRVEPEEIEAALESHPDVAQAAVVAQPSQSGRNPLAGFVTLARRDAAVDGRALVAYLRERLPPHMVPARVSVLETFPLTANQKVDRRALLAMGDAMPAAPAAALSPTETAVLAIWRELLSEPALEADANFFEAGGSSLLAIRINSRVEETLGVRLPAAALFEQPTVRALAAAIDATRAASAHGGIDAKPAHIERIDTVALPLSGAQYRLWYLQQRYPDSTAYTLPDLLVLRGPLDRAALARAIEAAVADHESLRTRFAIVDAAPVQIIDPPGAVALEMHDLSGLDADARGAALSARIRDALETPFDLERGPLARFALIRRGDDDHVLLSCFHHIVIDGWSSVLFQHSLAAHYNALLADGRPRAHAAGTPRPLQYRDFAAWHRALLDGGERERQLAYWMSRLEGSLPTLQLPTDRPRPLEPSGRGAAFGFALDDALAARLQRLGEREGASLFMVLLAAYATLLARYARQDDLLIGVPAMGRTRPELESVVGFFVNTLPIRVRAPSTLGFAGLLEQVRVASLEAFDHQDIALEEIAARANAQREQDGDGLFQTMFSFQDADAFGLPSFDGLVAEGMEPEHRTAKFDLYLATWRLDGRLHAGFEYSTDLFDAATVERMADHFRVLLEGIVDAPSTPLCALPLLPAEEREHLLYGLNRGAMPLPERECVRDLFMASAALHPQRVAVNMGAESMTYAELDAASTRVARNLLAGGAGAEDLVGLMLGRNIQYLIAMLGVLKAGVAFTPMNPQDPPAKLDRIVALGDVRFLVCEADTREAAEALAPRARLRPLEALLAEPTAAAPEFLPLLPNSLAYVMYTSGSTGLPKGAMIEQRGMLNHLLAKARDLALDERDVVAEMAVTTFDVSVWQYLVALLVGGRTAIMPGDAAWEPQSLLTQLAADGVTVFESVPSHMKILLDELDAQPGHYRLDALRVYISNAEALPPALCDRWFERLPHIPVINTYGATECSDDTSHLWIRAPLRTTLPYVPIQGTLPNLRTYLLDAWLQPVPTGVVGEVYLGGTGVGRGYLGDPVRTAGVFLPDPFSSLPGSRLYKTGDLARYRPGDVLEFVGREDFQVKIRGQRVEIGEVEKAVCEHDNVRQAVVVAERDGRGRLYLLAYVVPDRHPAPAPAELRGFVAGRIAAYMVPAAFVILDAFPLNANGKVDRKRLPTPSDQEIHNRHDYVEPATPTEHRLAALWQELLEVDRVGALDSFLELGGHSLLAADLTLRIRSEFGVALPMRTLFATPQLRAVAQAVDAACAETASALPSRVEPLPAEDRYELAPCQIPEWYAYQMDPTSPVYNISVSDLFFTGALDREAFLGAWNAIVERHEILRVRFGYEDGRPVQLTSPRMTLDPAQVFIDRSALSGADAIDEANRFGARYGVAPFDFENGPLFRLHVVTYAGDFHQLIFVVHHIIWDETSLMNLMQELSELYNARVAGRPPALPALEVGYFDYVRWMHEQLRSGAFDAHRDYWLEMYRTLPPPLDLPTDHPRPDLMSYRGDAVRSWLPRDIARRIQAFLKQNDITLFQFQLAVLDHYLHRISGQNDFVVGCPIAGRADERLKPLLGLFATPMPIRCSIEPDMTFRDLLHQTVQRTIDAFEHYHYPSNQVIEQLHHEKDLSRPKLFSIMFGVQNNKTDLMSRLRFDGLTLSLENVVDTENKSSRFDLNFVVDQFGSDIMFSCIYNADLFHASSIETLLQNMATLMGEVLDDPDRPLHGYTMLGAGGAAAAAIHGPALDVPVDATMHAMMSRQAATTPGNVAVVADGVAHDYATLESRSNRLAHYLLSMGMRGGERVAVMMAPGFDLIVVLYAILKAGGCFVPIGTQYPQKRTDAILRASGARRALTHSRHRRAFNAFAHDVLCFDEIADALGGYADAPLPAVDPSASAYILHTSGSTGVPKGIEIAHRGVVNMLADIQRAYALDERDCVLFHTPYTFDVFIQDVFWPLSTGARVAVMGDELDKSPAGLAGIVERERVTLLQCVPSMLDAFVEARERGAIPPLPSLRQVICGAAALHRRLAERFASAFDCALANHYGPTEVTVDACRFDCATPYIGDMVPIGRPIANAAVYILDAHLQPVPRGLIGEIHVASPGLALGYLKDAEGTARAFIDHDTVEGTVRLYRTGDLGHCDRDGVIHFHGRRDAQFKIRGNRVELDEIDSVLRSHRDVAACAIRYREDANGVGRLVAYIEQTPAAQRIALPGTATPMHVFTLAQRPELFAAATALFAADAADAFVALAEASPAAQWLLTDSHDTVVACGAGAPVRRADHAAAGIEGLADALRFADAQRRDGRIADALLAFDAAVATAPQAATLDHATIATLYARLAGRSGLSTVIAIDGTAAAVPADALRPGLDRAAVREWLRQSLPDYMIPDIVHFIAEVPMTDSGKVDAKRLPDYAAAERVEKRLASTELQRALTGLWERLLGTEGIGVTDDFFVLGGQSLKAIEIVAEVNRRYGAKIQLREFYRNPTILALESMLAGAG